MTRDRVEQALEEAVATSNECFEGEDFEGARDWHCRAVALQELLHGPTEPKVH